MKLKYLIFISLFFLIMSAGMACAADDNATDETISNAQDVILSDSDDIYINDEVYEDGNDRVIYISAESDENVSVSVDDVQYINKPLNTCNKYSSEYDSFYFIKQDEIMPLMSVGKYDLKVKFNNTVKSQMVTVSPLIQLNPTVYDLSEDYFCTFYDNEGVVGDVRIMVDGISCYDVNLNLPGDFYYGFSIPCEFLTFPSDFKYGWHDVKITYSKSNYKTYVLEDKFLYSYDFYFVVDAVSTSQAYPAPKFINDITFYVNVPEDAKKDVVVTFEGKTYNLTPKNGEAKLTVSIKDLKLGEHTAYAKYSDSKYPSITLNSSFTILPAIIWPTVMSEGDDEEISIISPKGTSGYMTIYNGHWADSEDEDQYYVGGDVLANVSVTDGYGYLSLNTLEKGYYSLSAHYSIGDYNSSYIANTEENIMYISVNENNNTFSSSISATKITVGESVTIELKGSSSKSKASIYLNDKLFKSLSMSKGKISQKITGLKVGRNKISVEFNAGSKYYSKTYYVEVKEKPVKLTLKKVNVKKSAKKLVLKATLKINGKAVKGKKLKFKFNKKSYTAKTNKKGVAKVTIKKKVLKKLKVGKKVKYMVSYGEKTVKRTVKVKK